MEVKNVSRDGVRVPCFEGIASAAGEEERRRGFQGFPSERGREYG
jgi:hypothetical protein